MSRPRVLNARTVGRNVPGAVYVGRPSIWGNPFAISRTADRETVLADYVDWLHDNPEFVARVRRDLAGKDLICWCVPQACHAEILRDIAAGDPVPPRRMRHEPPQGELF